MKKFNTIFSIALGIIIFAILIFLPNIIEKNPNSTVRLLFCFFVFAVALLFVIFDIFRVIKERKYTTTILIVIVNVIMILVIACSIFLYYMSINTKDLERIVYLSNVELAVKSMVLVGMLLNQFFRCKRFMRKL